ncbi:MAG: [protein-PII] uridylyltransferase [Desulfuromonas sp.]|nr:MAG: [protein-PII] uridylyltransferase [Desulfuromonas sp.]
MNHQDYFFGPEEWRLQELPFDEARAAILDIARHYLDDQDAKLHQQHRDGASGREIVEARCASIDLLIRQLYRMVRCDIASGSSTGCALIAVGGYGRGELNPRSDIDLMFFYRGRDRDLVEQLSERMLYLLWDLGLDVGHSVRTDKDCIKVAMDDITVRTALLDGRYLCGDQDLYEIFDKGVIELLLSRSASQFVREKLAEHSERLKKYGSSVFLIEPNIKEGEGGLRDLQTAIWIARVRAGAKTFRDLVVRGIMSEKEYEEFQEAFDFLWRIRNELHFISSRKNEQLQFEHQERIANFLGYRDNKGVLAVEQFMQDYYEHATHAEHLSSYLIARVTQGESGNRLFGYLKRRNLDDGFFLLRGELHFSRATHIVEQPELMMKAFELMQQHDVTLSLTLKTLIRENLHRVNDKVRRSRPMNEGFLNILRSPKGVPRTLREMHHLRFLHRFIPEFRRIYCKVQHDAYHIYTVDIHSLFAVEEIIKLWDGAYADKKPLLTEIANNVEKRELLLLAVLFHDIGKGEGSNHSNRGADMIPTISRRLGLNREDRERLEFLVRHHLDMAHISQRRDMHDDKMIIDFAQLMQTSENLRMLTLLTFADIKAVGPNVWNEWKGGLLQELYEKTFAVLERSNFYLEERSQKLRNRKRKVRAALEEDFSASRVRETLRKLNTRYVLSYRSHDIIEHLRFAFSRGERSVILKHEDVHEFGYVNITISTLDIPGLFSKVAGVMAGNGLSILGAQIHTRRNGEVLDILQIEEPGGEPIDPKRWEKVTSDLEAVVEGRQRVSELVKKRQQPTFMVQKNKPARASRVVIDNDISRESNVIDIFASDRVGLLYEVTKAIKELGLYIDVAKISTKVDQAADTFYVRDIFAQKVKEPSKLEEIRTTLLKVLDSDEA